MNLSRRTIGLIAAGAAVLLLLIIGLSTYNGVQSTMVSKEQALSAKYSDNQNVLSNFRASIHEQFGIAQANTAALDKVLTDAIKGRYTNGSSAKPGSGSAFSAIVEAYPDIKNVSGAFEKIQTAIAAGREAFKNQQTALLDLLRDYQTWKNSGFPHSLLVSMIGAPSSNLEAKVGAKNYHGQAALDQMKVLVLTKDTADSFDSGVDEPLDFGGSDG